LWAAVISILLNQGKQNISNWVRPTSTGGQYSEALIEYKKVVQLDPKNADTHYRQPSRTKGETEGQTVGSTGIAGIARPSAKQEVTVHRTPVSVVEYEPIS